MDRQDKKIACADTLLDLIKILTEVNHDPAFRQLHEKFQEEDQNNYGYLLQDKFRQILWDIYSDLDDESLKEIERDSGYGIDGNKETTVNYKGFLENLDIINARGRMRTV